ncbi:MAG TPA: class I SAM-dependent methyltransferase [Candidatus Krumholzibacteria bacterium]|nr:class I SAM-dependent methyltransferase [Candidatus Krumholzibacteria bacterium]HPD70827.1 class I SAM-dependent methyltransferase [Candidatus Krumholzibacteria bacterium]HRY39473.1 class I SAM-dependent methyltransferase [Candidatus Krumholzibacteria bacterium]
MVDAVDRVRPRRSRRADQRTPEQLREHYAVETELAARLRSASRDERRTLYAAVYDELYRRVPHHPQMTRKAKAADRARSLASQLGLLRRFLGRDSTYLEIGPGDCALSYLVAKRVKRVYAVDVSVEIAGAAETPDNFQLFISDGSSIPVPPGSIDVAYSYQLMEHLHPDDAVEQLRNIYTALAPGGRYVCVTPNRLSGPHDISKYFDDRPTGFHLREYTTTDLRRLFRQAGFARCEVYASRGDRPYRLPLAGPVTCEFLLSRLPLRLRRTIARTRPVTLMLNCRFVGIK